MSTNYPPVAAYIDAKQFATLFSMSERIFWLWIQEGKLTAYKPLAKRTLVKRRDVEELIERSRVDLNLNIVGSAASAGCARETSGR